MKNQTETSPNPASIEAKILLNVKNNPVKDYLDQTSTIPMGYRRNITTHCKISFYKGWAGDRAGEIPQEFFNQKGDSDYVEYDIFCITAGANSGFTQYVLAIKSHSGKVHIATGSHLMQMHWVREEDILPILGTIKLFPVREMALITERDSTHSGYKSLRYGWCLASGLDFDQEQELVTLNGFATGLKRLPNNGAADASVIFIRKDQTEHAGWRQLVEKLHTMENGEVIQHYGYVPCAGTLVNVKKLENDTFLTWANHEPEPEITSPETIDANAVFAAVADGYEVAEEYTHIVREYFEDYSLGEMKKSYCKDDYYFSLLRRAGIKIAVSIAAFHEDMECYEVLKSWLDAGMTDAESRRLNSKKDSVYNHSYSWKGLTVAYESYGTSSPRHKNLCSYQGQQIPISDVNQELETTENSSESGNVHATSGDRKRIQRRK